jgi:outer membrane protein assembly factor BamB
VQWKAPLPGLGTSTPIVWGDRVFVTSQLGGGPLDRRGAEFEEARAPREATGGKNGVELVVHCFDRGDGRPVWEHRIRVDGHLPAVHPKHNLASPSPVTDGRYVFFWFGTGQLVALDFRGNVVWEKHLARDGAPFDVLWGHASSPALHRDFLILQRDHPDQAYLLALDKLSGKEVWRIDRGSGLRSYSTPLVVETDSGALLLINSNDRLEARAPASGDLLWHAGDRTTLAIPMPVFAEGMVYASRGYSSGPYMAVRPGGRGDVSKTHVAWFHPTRAPYVSSLVYYEGIVYMATEGGVVTAIDARTGESLFRERLGGVFTASPVAADGRIYFLSEDGDTWVLAAGPKLRVLARNGLEERTLASPAISGGAILIRSDYHLFALGSTTSR